MIKVENLTFSFTDKDLYTDINYDMKIAAAYAIAGLIPDEELNAENIIVSLFDERVAPAVAKAVAEAAVKSGAVRK